MSIPFTLIHLAAWLDLIEQARRFRNPKVTDPAKLRSAGDRANSAQCPPRYQKQKGSCFHRLVKIAQRTHAYSQNERDCLLYDANACLEHLVEISSMVSSTQDRLGALAETDWTAFRIELGNHMFPGSNASLHTPSKAANPRYRADIDG